METKVENPFQELQRLIPKGILERYFSNTFGPYVIEHDLIPLLGLKNEQMLNELELSKRSGEALEKSNETTIDQIKAFNKDKTIQAREVAEAHQQIETTKSRIWLAMVYSNPDLSMQEKQKLAAILKMSDELHLKAAAGWGDISYLQGLFTQYLEKISKDSLYWTTIVENVVASGHLDALQYVVSKMPEILGAKYDNSRMLAVIRKEAWNAALASGKLDIVRYLVSLAPDYALPESDIIKLYVESINNSNIKVLQYLDTISPFIYNEEPEFINGINRIKDISIFQYFKEKLGDNFFRLLDRHIITFLISNKNFDMLKALAKEFHPEQMQKLCSYAMVDVIYDPDALRDLLRFSSTIIKDFSKIQISCAVQSERKYPEVNQLLFHALIWGDEETATLLLTCSEEVKKAAKDESFQKALEPKERHLLNKLNTAPKPAFYQAVENTTSKLPQSAQQNRPKT